MIENDVGNLHKITILVNKIHIFLGDLRGLKRLEIFHMSQ